MVSALPRAGRWDGSVRFATIISVVLALEGILAAQTPIPAKVSRYARRLIKEYDRNGDGKLQEEEWRRMHGQPARVDASGDGTITADELTQWIVNFGSQRRLRLVHPISAEAAEADAPAHSSDRGEAKPEDGSSPISPEKAKPPGNAGLPSEQADSKAGSRQARFHVPAKRLPPGLPPWFLQRDTNGDAQLTLSEFAPKATASDRQEFSRYDLNGDGVATPQECVKVLSPAKSGPSKTKTQ